MCDLALSCSSLPSSCCHSQTSGSSTTSTSLSHQVTQKTFSPPNTKSGCNGDESVAHAPCARDGNERSMSAQSVRNASTANARSARHERLASRWDGRRERELHVRRCTGGRYMQDTHNGNAIGHFESNFFVMQHPAVDQEEVTTCTCCLKRGVDCVVGGDGLACAQC